MKRLTKTLMLASIGALIGGVILPFMDPETLGAADMRIFLAILLAGLPMGWIKLTKIFGVFVGGGIVLTAALFVAKVVLSVITGWICLIVELIISIVEIRRENNFKCV